MHPLIGLAYVLDVFKSRKEEPMGMDSKGFCGLAVICFLAGGLFSVLLWKLVSYLLKHISWG